MILFLEPHFEAKPWAGEKLNKIYDCPEGVGEAWIVSGYNKKSSIIKNGRFKGESLRHVWTRHPELFNGIKDKEFPLLIKIIDAKEDLSVQVHPNDNYALEKHNSLGKFECWYFLNQNEAKTCIAGVKAITQSDLKQSIESNYILDRLIERNVNNGDLVVIEPGTVHALKAGTFVLEIQESSDITYRLYDSDRGRELHIEDSLNVIRYNDNKNPIHPFLDNECFNSKYFKLKKLNIKDNISFNNEFFSICYCLLGNMNINGEEINKGDTFIICSDEKNIEINGNGVIIVVTPKPKEERPKMRKIALITGIVTQDGSYLTEFLLKKNYEVHGLITSKSQINSPLIKDLVEDSNIYNKKLFFHIGDLTDTSSLNRLIENVKPDEIYNLASQSHVDISFDLPEYTTQVNSLGTLRLLDAIKQSDLNTKLFNESSSQVFGDTNVDDAQNEKTPFNPKNPYATSKVFAHFIVNNYREAYGIFAVNGILFNHTSERQDDDFIFKKVTRTVANIKSGKCDKLIVGNINTSRDFGYAPDYVEGMWLSLQQEKSDDYVFATGESHSVKELIEEAFKVIDIRIKWIGEGTNTKGINEENGKVLVEIDPNLYRVNDNKFLKGDSTKAKNVLGWEPKHKFKDMVEKMVKIYL